MDVNDIRTVESRLAEAKGLASTVSELTRLANDCKKSAPRSILVEHSGNGASTVIVVAFGGSNREPERYYIDCKSHDVAQVLSMIRGGIEAICKQASERLGQLSISV